MSHKADVRKSKLLAAASVAGAAVGLLTVPAPAQATPMFPLAPACNRWEFPGDVVLREGGTGWNVAFSSTGQVASGRATATGPGGTKSGNISGGINGTHVELTVRYDNGQFQSYIGDVEDDARLAGKTQNNQPNESGIFWRTVFPISCGEVPVKANPGAPSKTAFVTTPEDYNTVDVYDVPGGEGNVIGSVAKDKGVQVNADCKPDDWCLVRGVAVPTGQGWIWGHLRFE